MRSGRTVMAVLVAVVLLLSIVLIAFPSLLKMSLGPTDRPDDRDDDDIDLLPAPTTPVTREDVDALKEDVGVRDPDIANESAVDNRGLTPPTEEELEEAVDNMTVENSTDLVPPDEIPKAHDLSTEPYFPPVGDQGYQGSCVAWAVTYYSYGYMLARSNGWTDAHDGNAEHLMSPSWAYNKVNYGYDRGSSFIGNYQLINNFGAVTMGTMPYDPSNYLDWGAPDAWREAYVHSDIDYATLKYDNSTGEAIKNLVLHNAPVVFGMWAANFAQFAYLDNGEPIFTTANYNLTGGGHAQTVVGYDDSIQVGNETGAFRVVNSWGSAWGDEGFYWVTYDCMKKIVDGYGGWVYYISDIKDRNTSTVASVHFSDAPAISYGSRVTLGVGGLTDTSGMVDLYLRGNGFNSLPRYMCLDISDFVNTSASRLDYELSFSGIADHGVVDSFHIESYGDGYSPDGPSQISAQPPGLPASTAATVSGSYVAYNPAPPGEVLNGWSFDTGGFERWLSSPENGTMSMRSGDVVDGGTSWMTTNVVGPGRLNYTWRASSQESDVLSLEVDGSVARSVSGESSWTNGTIDLTEGAHQLRWQYSKDAGGAAGEDCGWLGSLEWTPRNGAAPEEQNITDNETNDTLPPTNQTNVTKDNSTTVVPTNVTPPTNITLPTNVSEAIMARAKQLIDGGMLKSG